MSYPSSKRPRRSGVGGGGGLRQSAAAGAITGARSLVTARCSTRTAIRASNGPVDARICDETPPQEPTT